LDGDGVGAGREAGERAGGLERAADRVLERAAAAVAAGRDATRRAVMARGIGVVEAEAQRRRILERGLLARRTAVGILNRDGVAAGREARERTGGLERAANRIAERAGAAAAAGGDAAGRIAMAGRVRVIGTEAQRR